MRIAHCLEYQHEVDTFSHVHTFKRFDTVVKVVTQNKNLLYCIHSSILDGHWTPYGFWQILVIKDQCNSVLYVRWFRNDRICNQISLNNTTLFTEKDSKVLFVIRRYSSCVLDLGYFEDFIWPVHTVHILICTSNRPDAIHEFTIWNVFQMHSLSHTHMHNAMHRPFKMEWQKI